MLDMDPALIPGGFAGLLAAAIIRHLLNEKKRLEQELRQARRLHLHDLRKLPDPADSESPPST